MREDQDAAKGDQRKRGGKLKKQKKSMKKDATRGKEKKREVRRRDY